MALSPKSRFGGSRRSCIAGLNADCDGQAGLQKLAGHATMLFYMTEEGQEGKRAYLDKRPPEFDMDGYRP